MGEELVHHFYCIIIINAKYYSVYLIFINGYSIGGICNRSIVTNTFDLLTNKKKGLIQSST